MSQTSIRYLIRHTTVILTVGLHLLRPIYQKANIACTVGSNQQLQDYSLNVFPAELHREICRVGFNILLNNALLYSNNVTSHCITTRKTSCIEHVSYYFFFIKTENIADDEFGRIICSYPLTRAHTYFYIKWLCMHDAVKCNIVANYSAVQ